MRSRIAMLFVLAVLALPGLAQVADDVAAFAKLPRYSNVKISPDGRKIAAFATVDGQRGIFTLETGTTEPRTMTVADEWHLGWLDWVDNRYVLVGIKTPNRAGAETIDTRLIAFDSEAGTGEILFEHYMTLIQRHGERVPQYQDRVLQTLPHRDELFVIAFAKEGKYWEGVHLANARTGRLVRELERRQERISRWQADASGDVRVAFGWARKRAKFVYRIKDAAGKWHNYSDKYGTGGFRVIGLPVDDTGEVFVLSDHEFPMGALYRFEPASGEFIEMIARHDDSEISGIQLSADGSQLEAVFFASDFVPDLFLDERLAARITAIRTAVPDLDLMPESRSLDGNRVIMRSHAADKAPGYYLFDANKGQVAPISTLYPDLESRKLATPLLYEFEARDGLPIDAYVTLPPGVGPKDASGIPFVVSVHGGPNARDFLRFDWETQMLAARGYGVLQINYRGSTGYGREFREAGDREWGQSMQDDIADGTRWIVEQGWADPRRICIIGASYGGYAALMGAARDGDLYRCAVSLNGVADLRDYLMAQYRVLGGRAKTRHIGQYWKDRRMLEAMSPVNHAEAFDTPVLLLHAEKDRVVNVRQSRDMFKALRRKGRDVQYVELPGGTHALEREANRLTYAQALVDFLDLHLAAAPERAARRP